MNSPLYLREQSAVFDLAKWPMMVLVVFIHTLSNVVHPVPLPLSTSALMLNVVDGGGIYLFISELVSHSLGRIAVPFFFFISGYLLLYKEDYSLDFYKRNLKKKARTLLLPYILWNLICLGIYFLKVRLSAYLGLEVYEAELLLLSTPLWQNLIEPVNFPLWYVRDLIVMNLLLPFFYYLFRSTGGWGILALYLGYLFGLELPIPGFGAAAMLYVGAGIYCGRHRVNVLAICHRLRYVAGIVLLVLVLWALFYNQHPRVESLIRLYIPLGIVCVFNLTAWVYRCSLDPSPRYRLFRLWVAWCRYCLPALFFVYVTHTLVINKMINRALAALGGGSGYWQLFAYFAGVGLTVMVCIIGYRVLMRLSPRLMAVLTGGRA